MPENREPRWCWDFYAELGWTAEPDSLSRNCCPSCHEDHDEGYQPLIDPPDGSDGGVCCAVIHAYARTKGHGR